MRDLRRLDEPFKKQIIVLHKIQLDQSPEDTKIQIWKYVSQLSRMYAHEYADC